MTATQQPRFRRPDGTVDLDALEAHAGPELFDAIMRGLATVCAAMEMPRGEPVQRRGRARKQEAR